MPRPSWAPPDYRLNDNFPSLYLWINIDMRDWYGIPSSIALARIFFKSRLVKPSRSSIPHRTNPRSVSLCGCSGCQPLYLRGGHLLSGSAFLDQLLCPRLWVFWRRPSFLPTSPGSIDFVHRPYYNCPGYWNLSGKDNRDADKIKRKIDKSVLKLVAPGER